MFLLSTTIGMQRMQKGMLLQPLACIMYPLMIILDNLLFRPEELKKSATGLYYLGHVTLFVAIFECVVK